ncbi:MAG: hypothetical protein WCD70_03865 [Alphaproteobacteria bacterium]
MKKRLMTTALLGLLAAHAYSNPALAGSGGIQMLPPTPLGSTTVCPSGTQQVLSYSGTPQGGAQGGINCVPIATDAQGDLAASGYIQAGQTSDACTSTNAGAIRFNKSTVAFEGCNGSSWQAIGGGGLTIIEGGCQTYWSGCPAGYTPTSYFSPGTYNCCDKCGNPAWRYTVCSQ